MPSIEELKREKERLELERDIRRLREQNDRREAVEKVKTCAAGVSGRLDELDARYAANPTVRRAVNTLLVSALVVCSLLALGVFG